MASECDNVDSLAQQVEHNTFNVGVLGSSPRRITEKEFTRTPFFVYIRNKTDNYHIDT